MGRGDFNVATTKVGLNKGANDCVSNISDTRDSGRLWLDTTLFFSHLFLFIESDFYCHVI